MILSRFPLKLFIICSFFLFQLTACEGGKSKSKPCSGAACNISCPAGQTAQNGECKPSPSECLPGQHLENGVCKTDNLGCPVGQILKDGKCINEPLQCPQGQHEENGECVLSPVDCPSGQVAVKGECVDNVLTVNIENQMACWIDFTGATRLILQYTVRDASGVTVDPVLNANNTPTALRTELLVHGRPVDVESLIDTKSELLNSDLVLSLVLDASSSMLEHNPPAFEPMKSAAMAILRETKDEWQSNNALFHWELTWFNSRINKPLHNNAGEAWTIADINNIQIPTENAALTGLYKAVASMSDVHNTLYSAGIAAGERDQHVMIVFTDGKDNNSYFDNSDITKYSEENSIEDSLYYQTFGYRPIERDDLSIILNRVPNLRTFVIGFGDGVSTQELLKIAEYGKGQYFYGDNSGTLNTLFETVRREFVTQLTLGAEIPLPPNEYTFTIEAEHLASGVEGQISFSLNVSPTALPLCPEDTPE